jgi:hypothetical protein
MGLRGEWQKKIDKKLQEIAALELQVRDAKVYVQALEDMMRYLPRDEVGSSSVDSALRPGTAISKARDAIMRAGRPLHITEILAAIGRPADKANRAAIGGSIAAYVRRSEVFTRPEPNTFGLLDMNGKPGVPNGVTVPPDFGKD